METSRLFVALAVPREVQARLAAVQSDLRPQLPSATASWPRAEKLHLTLRFLGSVANENIAALKSVLDGVAAVTEPMRLTAEGVGCFPALHRPAFLWAGVAGDADRLEKLQRNVVEVTDPFAQTPAERSFAGHVTLARFKRLRAREVEQVMTFLRETARQDFGSWLADEVLLIRSELASTGSRYTTLAMFPFRGGISAVT